MLKDPREGGLAGLLEEGIELAVKVCNFEKKIFYDFMWF